jgi:hypothetical protein
MPRSHQVSRPYVRFPPFTFARPAQLAPKVILPPWGLGWVLFLILWLVPAEARGQNWTAEELDSAIVCVHEAGFGESEDCAAMIWLSMRRAQRLGVSLRWQLRAYASKAFSRSRTDDRRWAAFLNRDLTRPRGWPAGIGWRTRRPGFAEALQQTRRVIVGIEPDPCPNADYWDDPHEGRVRAQGRGLHQLDCGDRGNLFWSVPWAPWHRGQPFYRPRRGRHG